MHPIIFEATYIVTHYYYYYYFFFFWVGEPSQEYILATLGHLWMILCDLPICRLLDGGLQGERIPLKEANVLDDNRSLPRRCTQTYTCRVLCYSIYLALLAMEKDQYGTME